MVAQVDLKQILDICCEAQDELTLGAPAEWEEGFSLRFPSSRRGLWSFTPFCTHTHRRWGIIFCVSIPREGAAQPDNTVPT